jgi:hypothetical protein
MQVMPKLLRNVKLEPIAEKVPRTLTVRVNAGQAIIAHRILQNLFLLSQDSFPKVSVTKNRNRAEPEHIRTNLAQLNVSIAQKAVNALISK